MTIEPSDKTTASGASKRNTVGGASKQITAGEAIFPRLQALGVDYVFVNSGTDFPPIIEGLAKAAEAGHPMPNAVVVPHEHAAMGMAHGYYLMSGRAQAVMLHTNVGLANGATGALNAACDHVPMLLMSGRTPATEQDRFGARTVPIGWGQEMRDQTALVREACKWDYELRFPEQIAPVLDRGYAIANSTPKGPVYLSLPREVLCEDIPATAEVPPLAPVAIAPDDSAVATAAKWIAEAKHPLIIAQRGAGNANTFAAFATWVEKHAIAVSSWWATHLALATDHPCHIGQDPGAAMEQADVVIVLDCLAPWWPDKHILRPDARVIHIGPDPLFSRTPMRGFRCDLAIAGETDATLPRLMAAVDHLAQPQAASADRQTLVDHLHRQNATALAKQTAPRPDGRLTKARASHLLGAALSGKPSTVFSELGSLLGPLPRRAAKSWFQEPHSGGLGWSFPAAMGAKLAAPERTIVVTLGDGSYMFANPTACHQIAEALGIAIVVLVLNNAEWGAVRQSVKGLYPEGRAARANVMPLTGLSPVPDFTKTAQASRAWTQSVTQEDELVLALQEALRQTQAGKLALIDVKILPD